VSLWFFLISPSLSWEGHDWSEWKQITHAEKPNIESPQAGQPELVPLMRSAGPDSPLIDSIQGWEAKRDRILTTLRQLIGDPPGELKPPTPSANLVDEKDMGSYVRKHIRIAAGDEDEIPAYLLIPKNHDSRAQTMIVIHQTVAQGKDEPCGIEDKAKADPDMQFAVELVNKGFICLAPDMIGFGERIPAGSQPYSTARDFYRKYPNWSFFGKMVWDVQRIVDYLLTLPEVDPYAIGIMGHSHGGYSSIITAAFEPRISAVIASCAFTTLRADPEPNRWSHLTPLMPRLGFYTDDIKQAPIDWHEIIACIAPRSFFYWGKQGDLNFQHTENFPQIFDQLREVYALYGGADLIQLILKPGPHSFPVSEHKIVFDWLHGMRHGTQDNRENDPHLRKISVFGRLNRDLGRVPFDERDSDLIIAHSETRNGYVEHQVSYSFEGGERIAAYLLSPPGHSPESDASTFPGIVAFHQTVNEGKEETAGHAGKPGLQFGPELARRGYVVLIPDSICAGERITSSGPFDTKDFYKRHPENSALGKMIADGIRAVDILSDVPGVDDSRIAVIGHSLGAEEALFVAAFDDRVMACVSSCGFAPFSDEKDPSRWARDHWFSYMPRLRVDLRAGRLPAWDFDDVIKLVAPRAFYLYQTTEDEIFPQGKAMGPKMPEVKKIWDLTNSPPDRIKWRFDPGPHDINPAAKADIYDWLDAQLKPSSTEKP